jgi:hypothetical protein
MKGSPVDQLEFLSRASGLSLDSEDPAISIHPLSDEGILLKIEPPRYPANLPSCHVPCELVLVIDISGSMNALAPAMTVDKKGDVVQENAGFSVLDITKHAALTILETLDDCDKLGIVTFSTNAQVCPGRIHASRLFILNLPVTRSFKSYCP